MVEQKARTVTTEYQQLRDAVETVAGRIADMLRDLPDTGVRIPNSDWSVGEAGAHLVVTQGLFTDGLKGQSSPYDDGHVTRFAPTNAQMLGEFPERDGAKLADLLVDRTRAFLAESAKYSTTHQIHYHWGAMELPTWTSYMLVHLLMHGYPIATALGQPSPLEPAHSDLAVTFLKAVMPRLFHKKRADDMKARLEIRLRGGRTFVVIFNGASVTVEEPPTGPADCYLSADPVAFFLVAFGLAGQWGLIAQGKLLAWGRKPWLALRFKNYFPSP
jgi:uncharacterized protein (TIGR03083 family)